MIRKVFYGETNQLTATVVDLRLNEKIALGIVVLVIFWIGIYPQTMLNITDATSASILKKADILPLLRKH